MPDMNFSTLQLSTVKVINTDNPSKAMQLPGSKKQLLSWFIILFFGMLMMFSTLSWGQNYQSFDATTTNVWTTSKWSASSTTNACVGTGLTNAFVAGRTIYLCTPGGTGTGAVGITMGGIIATENYTHSSPSGTLATGGTVATINVSSGKILDLGSTNISTAAGTGIIKAGLGTYISSNGNQYPGGFTLSDGTMVVGGVNAMGFGGALNINGGTMAANATRNITARYSGINIGGNFTFGTPTYASNITLADNVALGASTSRTITLGSTGTYTLGGVISGTSSNLTIAATAAGTLQLTGGSTYSGLTTVSGGTLNLNRSGGSTLPSGNSLVVNNGATVLISTAQTLNNVTVDAGGTLIVAATLTVTGTSTINGTFQINQGGWATGGTWTYGSGGTLQFNNTSGSYGVNSDDWWQTSNGPVNVTVSGSAGITMNVSRTVSGVFQTAATVTTANNLTLNGTGKINTGGFFAATPVWGASSTLIYNTGTTYGRSNEFPNSGNLPSNVQVSGNTTINYPGAGLDARTLTGDLTIDAGSAFYMDFGSPNPGVGTLTINSLILNGNMSLGNQTGGDLVVKGNFTRTGTFTPNSRAVYFNAATGNQTITGSTAFDYLIVDKAAGSVVLANDITVDQILTLTNGTISTSSNKVIISSNATGAVARTNGYVSGNLQRAINTGANTYQFAIGTSLGYTPATFAFTAVGGAGNITLSSSNAAGANYPAALNGTSRLARSWPAINSGVTGITGSATFTYLLSPSDLAGGAVSGGLKAYVYNGSTAYPTSNSNSSNSFTFNGITAIGEFGAGSCKGTLAPTFTKKMVSSCGGGADGSITVTPAGGTAPYTYSWTSTPAGFTGSTAAITGLSPRDYTVVVSEVTTCSISIPDITIWQAFAAVVTNNGTASGSCTPPTGSIILYGSGGIQPYEYSVDGTNYSGSNTFTGLAAGTYTGYVRDFANCVSTKPNITVAGASPLVVTAFTRPASSCANNGTIELYRTGGIAPYTYSINGTDYFGGNIFSNLAGATSYTGYVRDSKGCVTSLADIYVGKAATVTASATPTNTSACNPNTGRIQVLAGGGVPGYTYSITGVNGTYQSSNTFTGLAAGSYDTWVQDSKGCKNVQFGVVVGTNAAPTINVTSYVFPSSGCVNTGSIQLYLSGGGTGPYMYKLDNGSYQSSNVFTNLGGGTYTGWVKDVNGCTGSQAGIVISQAPALTVTERHTNASSCLNDGTIQLDGAGGIPGYDYSLDNITYQASNSFLGKAAGNYTGWVRDSKGCTSSVGVTVGTNAPISVTAYAVAATECETSNGSIQLFVSGGTGPYTYSLDSTNYFTSNTFNGLLQGLYTGYVKDSKSCIGTQANIYVGPECDPPIAGSKNNTTVAGVKPGNQILSVLAYPNPTSTEFTLQMMNSSKEKISIIITDIMGRKLQQVELNGKQQFRFGSDLQTGLYHVQVIQGNQKQSIKVIKE